MYDTHQWENELLLSLFGCPPPPIFGLWSLKKCRFIRVHILIKGCIIGEVRRMWVAALVK